MTATSVWAQAALATACLSLSAAGGASAPPLGSNATPAPQNLTPTTGPAGTTWTVVQRADGRHIVALFGGGELYIPQSEFEAASVPTTAAHAIKLMDVPDRLVATVVGTEAHIGDGWIVDAGQRGRFHVRVERLVLGYKDCGEGWGVVAAVAPDEAAAFERVPEQYFVARRERLTDASAPVTKVGPIDFTLSAANRAALVTLLETERQRLWPALRRQAEDQYARSRDSRDVERWRALDVRFDHGDAVLDDNVQAFRMTPDGDPRLFVRATWNIAGTVVFAMSAWVRVSSALSIDDVDASATLQLREGSESVGNPWSDRYLGSILNVVDTDGDGRGEILMQVSGYEFTNIELFVYPVAPGRPHVSIATYTNGC